MSPFTSTSAFPSHMPFRLAVPVQQHVMATYLRGCALGESDLQCRLDSLLHSLYVLAAVLGLLLILVVATALYVYHEHKSDGSLID